MNRQVTMINLRPPFKDRFSYGKVLNNAGHSVLALHGAVGQRPMLIEYNRYLLCVRHNRFLSMAEYDHILLKEEEAENQKRKESEFPYCLLRPQVDSKKAERPSRQDLSTLVEDW
jgi:hypothetical protein